jgi:uncharacterized protein (DUF608 family)
MGISRRRFLAASAATGTVALTYPTGFAAPYRVSVHRDAAADGAYGTVSGFASESVPLRIPAAMPMGSGAPLGGVGTGFVEIRADGCFHEWQIFNSGPWAMGARSTTAPPPPGPQYLRFLLRTKNASGEVAQVRRLYLRSDENDLYSLPFVQDVESIEYLAAYPMTGLRYNDPTIPVRVSALVFSPFIPGNARESATPGFHIAFTLENPGSEPAEVSLVGLLDNPLASALPDRRLSNRISQNDGVTAALFLDTDAQTDFPSGIGNMCLSVTGGEPSWITGSFREYLLPGLCRWETPRLNYMLLDIMHPFADSGRLPNSQRATDPSLGLPTASEIDSASGAQLRRIMADLSSDPLLNRVFTDAASSVSGTSDGELLNEVRKNVLDKEGKPRLTWGTGALASTVRLAPGQKAEIRFTLSWYFPHHLTLDGHEIGHMYTNWFSDAADVNRFLCVRYIQHRSLTEKFARTLCDTTLGDALGFAWSSQLSTLVFNSWWSKSGDYAIWEGLGCCGLSTTDVDYQGSFPVVALFPELKLSQMQRIITRQNQLGQVPHNYDGSFDQVDPQGFARVDMNPQFVMMVCRDYLWTGGRDYLAFMWPHVVRAIAFTQSLDSDGDGLPDRDTGFQTYDQWKMRGTPAYIASLWIGALSSAVVIAQAMGETEQATSWNATLSQASASFDRMLFNGDYYSLWVDGKARDELCMTDQISGEWFTHLIGLPSTVSKENLQRAMASVFRNNFNREFGVHNATAPRRGPDLLTLNNLQAGGVWSGIEFAFASLLIDHGHYTDGVQIVEAINRRYLRAGQPWNHVECGGHYSRAMSSWTTMLAAAGFKPDLSKKTLALMPAAPGDFRVPWVTASGFGTLSRAGQTLSLSCAHGQLELSALKLRQHAESIRLGGRNLVSAISREEGGVIHKFSKPVIVRAAEALQIVE